MIDHVLGDVSAFVHDRPSHDREYFVVCVLKGYRFLASQVVIIYRTTKCKCCHGVHGSQRAGGPSNDVNAYGPQYATRSTMGEGHALCLYEYRWERRRSSGRRWVHEVGVVVSMRLVAPCSLWGRFRFRCSVPKRELLFPCTSCLPTMPLWRSTLLLRVLCKSPLCLPKELFPRRRLFSRY